MTLRELVTRVGFRVDERGLQVYDKAIGRIQKKTDNMFTSLNRMADGMVNLGRRMSMFVSLPIIGLGIASVMASSKVESLEVSLTTMLGSAKQAHKTINEMIAFAAKTPFDLPEVQSMSQMLIGMGVEAKKLIPTLNGLATAAAATGGNLFRIAINLGQVKTKGGLEGRELKDFQQNYIPMIELLADSMGKTEKQIDEMITAGKIGYEEVTKAFGKAAEEGGRWAGLLEKRSLTIGGIFRNIIDGSYKLRVAIGQMITETLHLHTVLGFIRDATQSLADEIQKWPKWLQKTVVWAALLVTILAPLLMFLGLLTKASLILEKVFAALGLSGIAASGGFKALFTKGTLLLGKILLIVAAVASLILIFQDLAVWARGGKSFLAPIWDAFGKLGNKLYEFDQFLKRKWRELIQYIKDVTPDWMQDLLFLGGKALRIIFGAPGQGFFEGFFGGAFQERKAKRAYTTPAYGGGFGAMGTSAAMPAATTRRNVLINVGATQTIQVPEGTSEEQLNTIKRESQKMAEEIFEGKVDQVNSEIERGD